MNYLMKKKKRRETVKKPISLQIIVAFAMSLISFIFSSYVFFSERIPTYSLSLFPYFSFSDGEYINASFNVANNSNRDFSILDIWFSYGNTPTQNKYLRNVNDVKFPIIIEKRKVTNFEEYKDNILPIDELYKNGELVDFEYRLLLKKHFSEYVAQFTSNSSKLIRKSLDNKNLKYIKIYINLQVLKQNGKTVVIRIPYDNLVICKDIDEANQGYVPSFMENQYKPRNSNSIVKRF